MSSDSKMRFVVATHKIDDKLSIWDWFTVAACLHHPNQDSKWDAIENPLIRYHRAAPLPLTFAYDGEWWSCDQQCASDWYQNAIRFVWRNARAFRISMDSIDCNFHTSKIGCNLVFHVILRIKCFDCFAHAMENCGSPFLFAPSPPDKKKTTNNRIETWQDNRLLPSLSQFYSSFQMRT